MPEKDTWTIIKDTIDANEVLNKRQDNTAALLYWDDDPYKLFKPDGKTEIKDALPVTPNLPKVFAHGVISDLLGGKWQTKVEGAISTTQAHKIESFGDDAFAEADEFLLEKHDIPSLQAWNCNHVCVRWAIGTRWLVTVVDGEYKIECLPVDMRWTPFVRGKWVAPIFKYTLDELEPELEKYERAAKQGHGEYFKQSFSSSGTAKIEVRDYWDYKKNEVLVAEKLVYKQKNIYGKPPFVIVVPATGFMLTDEGSSQKHKGEDILFLNAGVYKEYARLLSLGLTAAYRELYPPYERELADIDTSKPSLKVPEIDTSLDVKKGERHEPVPSGDMKRAGTTAYLAIKDMVDIGGPLSPRQYNTPPSAVLLAGETEMISRLHNARKDALGISRSQSLRLIIEELRIVSGASKKKSSISIGKQGMMNQYSIDQLGDPKSYAISYHLSVKSKRQELANLAEYLAAVAGGLPVEWCLNEILMADDPAGIIQDMELAEAERINPAIKFSKMAIRYASEAKDIEKEDENEADLLKLQSKILTREYVMEMRARVQPAPTPQIKEPKGSGELLAQMGGAVGAMAGEAAPKTRTEEAVK